MPGIGMGQEGHVDSAGAALGGGEKCGEECIDLGDKRADKELVFGRSEHKFVEVLYCSGAVPGELGFDLPKAVCDIAELFPAGAGKCLREAANTDVVEKFVEAEVVAVGVGVFGKDADG